MHAASSPGPQPNVLSVVKGPGTMLAAGSAPYGAMGEPSTQHKVLRGILHPGDQGPAHTTPARALAEITSGQAGYHLGLAMRCLCQWIKRRWPTTGDAPTHKLKQAPTQGSIQPPGHNNTPPAAITPSIESFRA